MNIILFGYPSSGKSTSGKLAARLLCRTFVDTDTVIEALYYDPCGGRSTQLTVRQIVREHGEEYFRNLEREAIKKLRLIHQGIVAVGGGAVLDYYNYLDLKKYGTLVYLLAEKEALKKRLLSQKSLPAYIDEADPAAAFEALYAERQPIYERVADSIIDVRNLSPEEVALEIQKLALVHDETEE